MALPSSSADPCIWPCGGLWPMVRDWGELAADAPKAYPVDVESTPDEIRSPLIAQLF